MNFKMTEDTAEMVEIAKSIVKDKTNIYTPEKLLGIRNSIIFHGREGDSEEDIEQLMYRTIYYYWAFGCSADEYFYYNFENLCTEEIKKYVTVRERIIYTDYLNRREDIHLLNNKWECYQYFSGYYKRDVIKIESDNDFPLFLDFVQKHEDFVVKPTDLGLAQGVHMVSVKGYDTEQLRETFQKILAEISDNRKIYKGQAKYILLEEVISQSAELGILHPDSVNAIRITTVRVGDDIKIVHPWIKIGRGGKFVTSGACGSFDAGINADTGIVETEGITELGDSCSIHPDTGVAIKGFKIPRWKEAVALAKELAVQLPTIAYIGWDLVLTDKGWSVMEGNARGEFLWQLLFHRGTKAEFEELIGWSINKEYWWE